MAESPSSNDPKPLYAGRLRLADESKLATVGATQAFDQQTNQKVIVAVEAKTPGRLLSLLTSATHAHLNPIVDVIERDEDWLVISRDLEALTLSERVARIGKKQPVDAVRVALRVADAISQLHELGHTHGRVHPDNVLVGLVDLVEPSLLFGTRCPEAFQRPERKNGAEPLDPRDDTWATTALLYFMLTGSTPPTDGLESTAAFDSTPIEDQLLREVLLHGLDKSGEKRAKTLSALKHELVRWFIAHAADEPIPLVGVTHKPPPLPPSMASMGPVSPRSSRLRGAEPRRTSSKPPSSTSLALAPNKPAWLRSVPIAVGAAVLGIAVAWGLSLFRKGETTIIVQDKVIASAPSEVGATSTTPAPIDLAEVPVTGEEQQAGDATASCVRGYLREGTLVKVPQLDSICKGGELLPALITLRQAFATSTGVVTGNLPRFDSLGWYSVPTLAGLRHACCGDGTEALKLPPNLTDACPDFAPALEAVMHAISSSQSLDAATRRFNEAAICAAKSGRAPSISPVAPGPVSERTFRDLFASTQPATDASAPGSTPTEVAPPPIASAPGSAPTEVAPPPIASAP